MYSNDTLSQTQAFEWHRRFRKGTESFEDAERPGRPQTSHTAENIEKVSVAGHQFQSAESASQAELNELKDMAQNGIQKCFDDLYKRWNKCVVAQESYFKGGCVSAI
ncbi:hypothetical protein TNCV_4808651 [Trichonephila clavipes]|nr:hypothetical protein TNCV_4808651 [Trichonephila clavipes]